MENNAAIEIRHIRKSYNTYTREFNRFREAVSLTRKSYHSDFVALKDVNLTVYKGECVGVIGTNGSLTGYGGGIDKKIKLLKLEGTNMTGLFVPSKGTAL